MIQLLFLQESENREILCVLYDYVEFFHFVSQSGSFLFAKFMKNVATRSLNLT